MCNGAMTPVADLLICLRFFSRLPIPTTSREIAFGSHGFVRAAGLAPLAGALLALGPALVLVVARFAGLPSNVAALLAIASLVAVTGALHEDGLADCADGFGGGRTRERKLEIMRDSRIGTFGAAALVLSLALRSAALAAALARGLSDAAAALLLSAALSRTACLAPLYLLRPARALGLGAANARPGTRAVTSAVIISLCLAVLVVGAGIDAKRVTSAVVVAAVAALVLCDVARRQIGGQTGDVAGAAQQVAEAGVLLVFAAAP